MIVSISKQQLYYKENEAARKDRYVTFDSLL